MSVLYRIKDWDRHFESSETRKVKEFPKFVPMPNRFDSAGYAAFMSHAEAERLYGAWVVVVSVASRCRPRGTLIRGDGKPHTAQTLAAISRFKAKTFETLFSHATSEEVDWIEATPLGSAGTPADASGCQRMPAENILEERRGEESIGDKRRGSICTEIADSGDSVPDSEIRVFQCDGEPSTWKLMKSRVDRWSALYPSLDILRECEKAAVWLEDNPGRRKTAKGMPKFLSAWLERSQNRGGGTRAGPVLKATGGKPSWLDTEDDE